MLLQVSDLEVSYGSIKAIHGVSFHVEEAGDNLIGANGKIKSTIGGSVVRLLNPDQGTITYKGHEMEPHHVVNLGMTLVPEGRRVFGNLTVLENLKLAAFARKDKER